MCGIILTAFPKIVLLFFLFRSQLLLVPCLLIAYFTKIKYLATYDCIIEYNWEKKKTLCNASLSIKYDCWSSKSICFKMAFVFIQLNSDSIPKPTGVYVLARSGSWIVGKRSSSNNLCLIQAGFSSTAYTIWTHTYISFMKQI